MSGFAAEYEEYRTILNANYANPDRIAYPGTPFKPNASWDEWLDVDHNHGGQPPLGVGGPVERLDFGGNTLRTSTLDIGIHRKLAPGAEHAARTTADAILAYAWTDTTTTIYRPDLAYLGRSRAVFETWWVQDLLIPIWRQDDAVEAVVPNANQKLITQVSHGFAVQDWIYFDGSTWAKAQADSQSTGADGVVSAVTGANNFVVTFDGPVEITSHGYSLGPIYLSTDTAGAATTTEPSGALRQYLGKAYDANNLFLNIGDILLF